MRTFWIRIRNDASAASKAYPLFSRSLIFLTELVNPELQSLAKGDDGLFYLPDAATAEADASIKVVSGYVEGSNVNVVDAMVTMIELARDFEMQSKMMKTSEENDGTSSKLLTMN